MEWNVSPSCPVFRGVASFMGFPNSCQDPLVKNILEAGVVPLPLQMRASAIVCWNDMVAGNWSVQRTTTLKETSIPFCQFLFP